MDLLVLQRLTAELDEELRGQRIEQVWALPKNDVVLAVGRRSAPRLWLSTEPDDPHLYLRRGTHWTPQRPPGFAMAARGILNGRHIAALNLVQHDRIVELACAGEGAPRIVFELIPRRATLLVLDADDEVRAVWQPRRGRPALGDAYTPPRRDRRTPLAELDASAWADLEALPDHDELVRGLLRTIAAMSPLVAREIAHRHHAGTPLPEAARAEIERAREAESRPRIYAPAPLGELTEPPAGRQFLLAPYPLQHREQPRGEAAGVETHPSLIDAAATFYPLRACLEGLQAARATLTSALEIAAARARRAHQAVADDADSAGDADEHRRRADLLLAYPQAATEGSIARLPDPYAGGAETEIDIDPSMSLIDNAQAYYRRARRAERSAARTAARRRRLQQRQAKLTELLHEVGEARELSACRRIARQARTHGVDVDADAWLRTECSQGDVAPESADVASDAPAPAASAGRPSDRQPPKQRRDAAAAKAAPAGVDAFVSTDGFEILVGRSAQGNEKVTHKLASPHDFWLHAEGPGSHVVIRNPTRADEPSDDALRQAASLAAYFSRSRGATKVNVRWTQVRHVRKPRGAPAGQVVLRRSNTFLAEPLPPARLLADDADEG